MIPHPPGTDDSQMPGWGEGFWSFELVGALSAHESVSSGVMNDFIEFLLLHDTFLKEAFIIKMVNLPLVSENQTNG